jgi:AAA domain
MKAETLVPIRKGAESALRLSMLLWGQAGNGKTTWAATAPGDKLWLSFGDSEHASVSGRDDVHVMDLSSQTPDKIFQHGIGPSPFGLDAALYEMKNIKTVVCDSLTAVQYLGLQKAVSDGIGASKGFAPSMQAPGRGAFGGRNQNLLGVMKSLLSVTNKHRVNIIFTAHENDPVTRVDSRGTESVDFIGMSLGGQLVNNVSAQISEIWNLRQEPMGKRNRIVTTRVSGARKPMKTRMFNQKGESSFVLNYDPERPDAGLDQMTLAKFYEQWAKSGFRRIMMPSTRPGGDGDDNKVTRLGPQSI